MDPNYCLISSGEVWNYITVNRQISKVDEYVYAQLFLLAYLIVYSFLSLIFQGTNHALTNFQPISNQQEAASKCTTTKKVCLPLAFLFWERPWKLSKVKGLSLRPVCYPVPTDSVTSQKLPRLLSISVLIHETEVIYHEQTAAIYALKWSHQAPWFWDYKLSSN